MFLFCSQLLLNIVKQLSEPGASLGKHRRTRTLVVAQLATVCVRGYFARLAIIMPLASSGRSRARWTWGPSPRFAMAHFSAAPRLRVNLPLPGRILRLAWGPSFRFRDRL